MTREEFILKHKNLFWYTPREKLLDISDDLLVEVILNDGTLADYKEMMNTLGNQRVADVFFAATDRKKLNYYPEIHHLFSLVLEKYASRNIKQ